MFKVLKLTAFLLSLVAVVICQSSRKEESIILQPVVDNGPEVALLMVPGAYINGAAYQDLGEAVQAAASALKLWIALVRPFAFDLPNPPEVIHDIDQALLTMRDMGMETDFIFVAGHSLGGVMLQSWVASHPETSAMVMLGSELQTPMNKTQVPVMIMSGDLDGLERITSTRKYFKELEALIPENAERIFTNPVVVLEDVNHMHVASGEPTPTVKQYDIPSPMDFDTAHALMAQQMSAFISVITGLPEEGIEEAKSVLAESHDNTKAMMKPLEDLAYVTEGDVYSMWSIEAQLIMSGIIEQYRDRIEVLDTLGELGHPRPTISLTEDGNANVTTYTDVNYHGPLENQGIFMQEAREMAIKLKSQEAIKKLLEPLGVEFGPEISCKDINEAAVALAYETASDIARVRFDARGRPITILPDDVKITGSGWLLGSTLHYNDTNTAEGVFVSSPSLPTGVNIPGGIGGMHYCRLLPPVRALEYIMVDSLRNTEVNTSH